MKYIKSFFVIIICAVNLLSIFYFLYSMDEKNNRKNNLQEFTANIQMKEQFYATNYEINSVMNGLLAPDIFCSEQQKQGEYLSEIVKKKPLLIYRYSDMSCNVCYETEIDMLQKIFSDYPDLICVLCSYRLERDFSVFKKANQIKVPLYRIPADSFNWIVENLDNPYYFVLNSDMKISQIFIPDKNYSELSILYLEGIKRLLE